MNGKFRVYDLERKKYLMPENCFIDGNGNFYYRDSQGMLNNWKSNFVVEHSTGQFDKNNKEIFKGDILAIDEGNWRPFVDYMGGRFYLTCKTRI